MMLNDILKQFKNIEPDATYKEKSKRAILAQLPKEKWNLRRMLLTVFESGMGVALTVFFILIVVGQFPGQSSVTPVQLSVINPETLHAEAQAVDIQIQLASVAYQESTATIPNANATTPATIIMPAQHPTTLLLLSAASSSATSTATITSSTYVAVATSTSATTTLSVDEALQELTK